MTLNQLMAFIAAAKHRNVTCASKELHVTQSAVSRQLRRLEEKHGSKLYRRTGRGIELTAKGKSFLADAQAVLSHMQKIDKKWDAIVGATRREREEDG